MNELEYIYNTSISKIVGLTRERKQLEKFLITTDGSAGPSRAFVRDTPLSLARLLAFMIMPRAGSCQGELETFFNGIGYPVPTKSAFSMRRRLISPDIFRHINREVTEEFYYGTGVRRWKGRYIIAVDGTTLTMPVGSRFEPLYGSAVLPQDRTRRLPTARAVVLMDVLNNQILDIRLGRYGSYEPEMAVEAIMDLPGHILDNAIFVFDRLYMSYWLLTFLQDNGIQYIMRCRRNFSPAIDSFFGSDGKYADVQLNPSSAAWNTKTARRFESMGMTPGQHRPVFVHLTKSRLPGGGVEVICSWVAGVRMSAAQCYGLYGRRWGIETAIGMEKNEWQVEMFSGYTRTAVLQDVYCKVISYNLCSMATAVANKRLDRRLSRRTSRRTQGRPAGHGGHRYRVNVNMALLMFKGLVIQVVRGKKRLHTIVLRYMAEVCRFYEPYRPGMSYPRNFTKHKINGKYATYTNYARVI